MQQMGNPKGVFGLLDVFTDWPVAYLTRQWFLYGIDPKLHKIREYRKRQKEKRHE